MSRRAELPGQLALPLDSEPFTVLPIFPGDGVTCWQCRTIVSVEQAVEDFRFTEGASWCADCYSAKFPAGEYGCADCGAVFEGMADLFGHLPCERDSDNEVVVCSCCWATFASFPALYAHLSGGAE